MNRGAAFCLAVLCAAPVAAQQPAPAREESLADREAARQRAQMRAGAAYRTVVDTNYQTRLAEQEVWAAEDAGRAYGADAAESKARLAKAQQALSAARAKEAAARAVYDKTLTEVERIERPAQSK